MVARRDGSSQAATHRGDGGDGDGPGPSAVAGRPLVVLLAAGAVAIELLHIHCPRGSVTERLRPEVSCSRDRGTNPPRESLALACAAADERRSGYPAARVEVGRREWKRYPQSACRSARRPTPGRGLVAAA